MSHCIQLDYCSTIYSYRALDSQYGLLGIFSIRWVYAYHAHPMVRALTLLWGLATCTQPPSAAVDFVSQRGVGDFFGRADEVERPGQESQLADVMHACQPIVPRRRPHSF